jgi:hypothetical protein
VTPDPLFISSAGWPGFGFTLVADPPLELAVGVAPGDNGETWLTADDADTNLICHGRDRDELRDDVVERLCFLWREYAEGDPVTLSPAAVRLGERLRARLRRKD